MPDATSIPIRAYKVLGGTEAHPEIRRIAEDAAETFKIGTPVKLDTSGNVIESPAIVSVATAIVAGIATEPGNNLTTAGTPKTLTYGSVQNQANAVLIPVGAPPNDGKMGLLVANNRTVFLGKVDDAKTTAQSDVGKIYGLTKATNGFWYVDTTITTTALGAVVEVLETVGDLKAGGLVAFKFTTVSHQLGT